MARPEKVKLSAVIRSAETSPALAAVARNIKSVAASKNSLKNGLPGALLEDFRWIIERAGSGCGASLNTDMEYGLDLEPEMLAQLTGKG